MRRIFSILLMALAVGGCHIAESDNPVEKIASIPVIKAYTSTENYSFLLENKMSDASIPAKLFLDDAPYKVMIKAQGAGSRMYPKWNYFVDIEEYKKINGLRSFNLSAQVIDPSFVRTPLVLHLYKQLGFVTFSAEPYFFCINDEQYGLYTLIERINEDYFASHNLPVAELIKVSFGATFTFNVKNDLSDNFEKKIPDDKNFNNLADFIYALDTVNPKYVYPVISKYINIQQYLRYHAVNTIINNSDGLTNNYYFYRKYATSPYEIIPWDFDKTFDYKINLSLYADNEIIKVLLKSDTCYAIYRKEMKDILTNYFTELNLYPVINYIYNRIKDVYSLDPWLRMNGIKLENEMTAIKTFITERRNYLLGLLQ